MPKNLSAQRTTNFMFKLYLKKWTAARFCSWSRISLELIIIVLRIFHVTANNAQMLGDYYSNWAYAISLCILMWTFRIRQNPFYVFFFSFSDENAGAQDRAEPLDASVQQAARPGAKQGGRRVQAHERPGLHQGHQHRHRQEHHDLPGAVGPDRRPRPVQGHVRLQPQAQHGRAGGQAGEPDCQGQFEVRWAPDRLPAGAGRHFQARSPDWGNDGQDGHYLPLKVEAAQEEEDPAVHGRGGWHGPERHGRRVARFVDQARPGDDHHAEGGHGAAWLHVAVPGETFFFFLLLSFFFPTVVQFSSKPVP